MRIEVEKLEGKTPLSDYCYLVKFYDGKARQVLSSYDNLPIEVEAAFRKIIVFKESLESGWF